MTFKEFNLSGAIIHALDEIGYQSPTAIQQQTIPHILSGKDIVASAATGTGKTKSLQTISEGLSDASVPVLLLDIKGDLSGIAAAGTANDKITERSKL